MYIYAFGLALKNVRKMMRDRGFVPDSGILARVPEDAGPYDLFAAAYSAATATGAALSLGEAARSRFRREGCSTDGGTDATVWCFDRNYDAVKCRDRMISTDQVKALQERIAAEGSEGPDGAPEGGSVCHVVLSPTKLSPQAKKETLDAQLFLFDDLLIDIPRHEQVVAHRVVSEAAVKSALGAALNVQDLPVMLRSDAVARWYNWPIGTLVHVDNPEVSSYRIVCDG